MTSRCLTRLVLAASALASAPASPLAAQEAVYAADPPATPLKLPSFTDQQRWARITDLAVVNIAAAMTYAKSRGQTPDDYGRFLATQYAPGWGKQGSGDAVRVFRGVYRNYMSFSGGVAQPLAVSDTMVTARVRRSWVPLFGDKKVLYGTTLDEFERSMRLANEGIASYLGVRYQERVDGDWVTMTIRGRGSAAPPAAFPAGTYAIAMSSQDAGDMPELAGEWVVTFSPNGRFTASHDGALAVEGRYDLVLDQITLRNETGPMACSPPVPVTYRWVRPADDRLRLVPLDDGCGGRVKVVGTRPLTSRP
jgi:hypothetical protein